MIKQASIGLDSRQDANPYNDNGFLPLITAPMYSVVDENNYQTFLNNKIRVCLPRNKNYIGSNLNGTFISLSLLEFLDKYVSQYEKLDFFSEFEFQEYVCIDTANGNMPALHEAIRKAKKIHGDKLIIMAGNVASVEAFAELAKTGVDYIRVGIGGGAACNTTGNTGVGNIFNLQTLIQYCNNERTQYNESAERFIIRKEYLKNIDDISDELYSFWQNIGKVKIVADGISSYITHCQKEYGFNDNGYAAINKLLFAGADLVMIGKLFAQCLESAGEKANLNFYGISNYKPEDFILENKKLVKYSGMSTHQEQEKYKNILNVKSVKTTIGSNKVALDREFLKVGDTLMFEKRPYTIINCDGKVNDTRFDYTLNQNIAIGMGQSMTLLTDSTLVKPSEGSVDWIPVRWTLKDWLYGSDKQDSYPYLMGWVNSIKSAMAYTNKTTL